MVEAIRDFASSSHYCSNAAFCPCAGQKIGVKRRKSAETRAKVRFVYEFQIANCGSVVISQDDQVFGKPTSQLARPVFRRLAEFISKYALQLPR
jgi:hypothetical protein